MRLATGILFIGAGEMQKWNPVVVYFFLVGVPLLALVGILRAGRALTPPKSVGGAWLVKADFTSLQDPKCRDLLLGVKQPFINISQSGPDLVFTLNNPEKTTIQGNIRGSSLTMGSVGVDLPEAQTGECLDPQSIYLNAQVNNLGGQRMLSGGLGIKGCKACAIVPFRAVRSNGALKGTP